MSSISRPAPWKAALLALFFVLTLGFAVAWTVASARGGAGAHCQCHTLPPAKRCFCPPLGTSCACER